ncbi:TetR/AcrR family transcriptional regulator [Mycobacterium montefiorense]|uniref:TetR/AcrR family transcriptional regulator n=1 Tax=Mycobacterium montefiorense TaxID=154654 RepID=UPI001403ABFF|nr:TetR/AcrR family transcriptional regulator [Mycobacterium montefiorense]
MPVERRTRRAGGTRRAAVVEAAAGVLAERGYENSRFADVARASGTAISTLQNYFGSREDMLIEAMQHATEVEVAAFEAVADAEGDPWNRLVAMVDRNLNTSVRNHQLLIEFWRSGIRDAELRDGGEEGWFRYRAPFVRTVIEGRDAGVFTPVVSPEDVVDLLFATLVGAMIPRVLRFPSPSADRFRTALLRQLAAMLGRTGYQ